MNWVTNGRSISTFLLFASFISNGSVADTLPTFAEITSKWKAKESRLNSFIIKWETTQSTSAGAPAGWARLTNEESTTVTSERFVLASDDRARFDRELIMSTTSSEDSGVETMHKTWIDGIQTVFMQKPQFSFASIKRSKEPFGRMLDLKPIVMACRMSDTNQKFFDRGIPVTVVREPSDEPNELRLIEGNPKGAGACRVLMVDAKRDFLPIRYERHINGRISSTVEILEFDQFAPDVWVPMAWKIEKFFSAAGKPEWVDVIRVTDYRIDPSLPDESFEVEFPAGTYVSDNVKKRKYVQ